MPSTSGKMTQTKLGLGDVLDLALRRWGGGDRHDPRFAFGAAGTNKSQVDGDLFRVAGLPGSTLSEPDPFNRMFATDAGRRAVNAVGNETKTLAAMQRLSVEAIAESWRL